MTQLTLWEYCFLIFIEVLFIIKVDFLRIYYVVFFLKHLVLTKVLIVFFPPIFIYIVY